MVGCDVPSTPHRLSEEDRDVVLAIRSQTFIRKNPVGNSSSVRYGDQNTPPMGTHVRSSWSFSGGYISAPAGYIRLKDGFQLNSEWVHSGATSGWWPAEEPAGGGLKSHSQATPAIKFIIIADFPTANTNIAAATFVFELDLRTMIVQELEVERKHIEIFERKPVQI
ncbi:hypothetical protein C8F04DRAFT_1179647 [Mycena alexandri]|uniref:Uncharacterized protein n=1 Tax=Mycena alexandri TaxID=1745969 RepID=A0AAD6T547_9AGAR|nr:hypothetical protein C8F04DRAFT_1179647 [Mycena alexandri]